MKPTRSLSVQAFALALGSGAAQVLVATLYILTARDMQPSDFGVVATAIAVGLAGAGFVDFGASNYWIRELASGRVLPQQLYPKMITRLIIALIAAGAVITIAAIVNPHFIATGVLLFTATTVMTVLVPLRATRRAELVGWLTVLSRTFAIVVFFGQIALAVEPGLALWTSLALGDLFIIIYVGATKRSGLQFTSCTLSNPWAGAKWYSLSTLSGSAQQLDLPVVAACAGATAAGIYGSVNRWIQPMVLTIAAFASASAPFLAAPGRLRALRSQVLRASWILAAAIILSLCVMVAAPWLVNTLLGEAFAASAEVLQWLAAAMILNTFTQPLIVALQSRSFDKIAAVILMGSVGIQLILVGTLTPTLGALGAGIGFFTSQVLQLVATATCIAVISWRRRGSRRYTLRQKMPSRSWSDEDG